MKNNLKYQKFKLDGWGNTIEGIFLQESEKWILTRHIYTDYMLDGYAIINKKHIKKTYKDRFKEKIMLSKIGEDYTIPFDLKIKSGKQIVSSFANENLLFQIEEDDENYCFIGKSINITNRAFTINFLTPKIKWSDEMTFDFNDIRAFFFMNDYLNTLESNCKKKLPPR